jgi:hypothetical protein
MPYLTLSLWEVLTKLYVKGDPGPRVSNEILRIAMLLCGLLAGYRYRVTYCEEKLLNLNFHSVLPALSEKCRINSRLQYQSVQFSLSEADNDDLVTNLYSKTD